MEDAAAEGCGRGPGRPRDPETDQRILRCALDQLAAEGFAGMSIDAVARAAGVSKATIYRRYADKGDLVTAAVSAFKAAGPDNFDGDIRTQLTEQLEVTRRRMIEEHGMITLHQILAESERNPELVRLHQERTIGPRTEDFADVVREGMRRGELRADIDPVFIAELISGTWMARWARGGAFEPDWSERVIETVWPMIAA